MPAIRLDAFQFRSQCPYREQALLPQSLAFKQSPLPHQATAHPDAATAGGCPSGRSRVIARVLSIARNLWERGWPAIRLDAFQFRSQCPYREKALLPQSLAFKQSPLPHRATAHPDAATAGDCPSGRSRVIARVLSIARNLWERGLPAIRLDAFQFRSQCPYREQALLPQSLAFKQSPPPPQATAHPDAAMAGDCPSRYGGPQVPAPVDQRWRR